MSPSPETIRLHRDMSRVRAAIESIPEDVARYYLNKYGGADDPGRD